MIQIAAFRSPPIEDVMPIYEYECLSCHHRYDCLCHILDADKPKTCPQCDSEQSKRRIAGGHFELKGSGWYKDGYAKR
jgi:putative FmdB family regulatory protein